jgi:hypothetical protein
MARFQKKAGNEAIPQSCAIENSRYLRSRGQRPPVRRRLLTIDQPIRLSTGPELIRSVGPNPIQSPHQYQLENNPIDTIDVSPTLIIFWIVTNLQYCNHFSKTTKFA